MHFLAETAPPIFRPRRRRRRFCCCQTRAGQTSSLQKKKVTWKIRLISHMQKRTSIALLLQDSSDEDDAAPPIQHFSGRAASLSSIGHTTSQPHAHEAPTTYPKPAVTSQIFPLAADAPPIISDASVLLAQVLWPHLTTTKNKTKLLCSLPRSFSCSLSLAVQFQILNCFARVQWSEILLQ